MDITSMMKKGGEAGPQDENKGILGDKDNMFNMPTLDVGLKDNSAVGAIGFDGKPIDAGGFKGIFGGFNKNPGLLQGLSTTQSGGQQQSTSAGFQHFLHQNHGVANKSIAAVAGLGNLSHPAHQSGGVAL